MITEKLKKHIAEQNIKTRKWMNSAPEGSIRIGTIYTEEGWKKQTSELHDDVVEFLLKKN